MGGCLDIFTLIFPFSPLSPSLWETARYRLKYCLKGPLNPKQPTNLPLQKRRDEMTLKYWARSASLGSKLPINSLTESKSIYTTGRNRLNWRTPYNIKVQDLLEKHNLKEIEIQQQTFPAKFDLKSLNPKHELTTKIKKTESTMQECEKMTKTYLENNYTRHLQIYTDGSKDSAANTAGCAFTIPKLNHTQKFKLHPLLTVYTSELIAILKALQWILENKPEKVILTDSLSAIQSLESGKSHTRPDILDQILYLIHCIIEADINLLIDWCPSHCNIDGNERADQAAKSALTHGTALNYLPTSQEVYPVIKAKIKAEWANDWRQHRGFRHDLDPALPKARTLYSEKRLLDRIFTRLRLGVNGLKANNLRYSGADPLCPHCGGIEDTDHFFIHCTAHTDNRNKLKSALQTTSYTGSLDTKKLRITKYLTPSSNILRTQATQK